MTDTDTESEQDHILRLRNERSGRKCANTSRRSEGRWSRLKSSNVSTAGKCAVRIDIVVPAASRSATCRCNTAAKYSSCAQFSVRACAARSSQTRPIVGVFNARAR